MIPQLLQHVKGLLPDRHPARLTWHWLKAFMAALRYGFPARNLTVIGITGTDGKTTTVSMTAHILHEAGIAIGAVSTSFFRIKGTIEENPTHKTSMSPFIFQKFLHRCVREGCTHVVAEISSHGLVQHRNDFLWPTVAAITNISPEHLDYHGTMEQYTQDKAILFRMLRKDGASILNANDETYDEYRKIPTRWRIAWSSSHTFASAVTQRGGRAPALADPERNVPFDSSSMRSESLRAPFSFRRGPKGPRFSRRVNDHECAFWSTEIQEEPQGLRATVHCNAEEDTWNLHVNIPGRFNLENALCAISCAHAVGVAVDRAVSALASFPGVPGRMERIDEGQLFSVYVDFTVTPKAYERTLSAIRATLAPGNRLLVLTGSCGNRMPEKRPMIGKIVSEMADVVVVSEDETVTEDPQKVLDEVWVGIDQNKTEAHQIFDRREGIAFLFKNAREGDAVALCGMGACTTMQTRKGLRPWDEREVARELLRNI